MMKLSQEIIDLICDELVDSTPELRLANYATISKKWQASVERKTFQTIQISLLDVNKFITIFPTESERRHYVKQVSFVTEESIEPSYEMYYPRANIEGIIDVETLAPVNQIKISPALSSTMKHISEWDLKEPITLSIDGPYIQTDGEPLTDIPYLKNIKRLASLARFVNPLDVCKLAGRIPQLEKFWFWLPHMDKQQRTELADEIHTWHKTLPRLNALRMMGEEDEYVRQPLGLEPEDMRDNDGIDRLCQELRLLTQRQGFIALTMEYVPISAEILEDTWNPEAKMEWPTLKSFEIHVHEMSSTGEWYFLEDEDERRIQAINTGIEFSLHTKPNKEEIDPLAQLFERSWEKMPELVMASMEYGHGVDGPTKTFPSE